MPVLLLAVAAYVLLAGWARGRRAALGIAVGTIASADDSLTRAPTLQSERLGLVGRCDHLLRADGAYLPVEHKQGFRTLQQSHILQVGALCMLVEDLYGVHPPYGLVVLADGAQARVPFTEQLERGVVRTMADCGDRWSGARSTGYRPLERQMTRSGQPTG